MNNSEKTYTDIEIFKRMILLARPLWGHIFCIFLISLLAAPLALLMPIPLKIAVDSVLSEAPLPRFLAVIITQSIASSKVSLLWLAVLLQLVIVLLNRLQYLGDYVLKTYTGERLNLIFRSRLFRHTQRLSFSFHDTQGSADTIYRIQYDTASIMTILVSGLIPFVSSLLTLLAMIYVMFRINVQLSLIAMVITPVLFLYTHQHKKNIRPKYRVVKKLESGALKIVQEVMVSFRVVKAFGREEREEERYINQSDKTLRQKTKLAFFEGVFSVGINLITASGTAAVFYVGVRNVLDGVITLGELLMVITYLSQLYGPLQNVSKQIASLQSAFASADRVFELMDEVPDVADKPNAKYLKRARGQIKFNNVSFSYDGKNRVLKNIDFHVNQGTRIGIAGKTGAGKTTLVSLLPRFYDVTQGQILLDGLDIREYRLVDLRNQFSIVLQEPVLFSTSIEENIRYAKPEATEEDVIKAAKAANAHDFIEALPQGYGTLVGERGMLLSGGERQRISLARAFLKDAPILILDEPTSSVDTKTETLIMDAMERLMKNRTTFMIAHRLSTLENCDLKIEMDNGQMLNTMLEDYSDVRLLVNKSCLVSNP